MVEYVFADPSPSEISAGKRLTFLIPAVRNLRAGKRVKDSSDLEPYAFDRGKSEML